MVYSLNRVLDPENPRKGEYYFIESITRYSDNIVTIKTKYPYAPTISSFTDPVTSIVSPNADLKNSPVGTGPFKFKSYTKDVSLTVERNDNYWNGTSGLDTIITYFAEGIPQSEVAGLKNNPDYAVYSNPTLRTYFLYVNMNKEPLNDVRVRQAFNFALDRQQIVDTALEGVGGIPAKSVFPSAMYWSINDKLDVASFNEQKARDLLAEAGFEDINGDGWLEYKGKPFELNIKTYTTALSLNLLLK